MRIKWFCVTLTAALVFVMTGSGMAVESGKMGIGIRTSYIDIQDDNNAVTVFDGSVDVEADETYAIGVNLTYYVCRWFSMELHGEYTDDTDIELRNQFGSGKVGEYKQIPVLLTARFHWSVSERFAPYAGGGIGYYFNDFDPDEGALGVLAGTDIGVDDSLGYHVAVGIEYLLTDHIALNFDAQYRWVEVDYDFKGPFINQSEEVEADQYVLGVGLKYYF